LAKFTQEFVRRDKERIFLEDAADDDHRVSAHDLDYFVAAKLPEMVRANNRIFVTAPQIIHTRLELNDILNMRLISGRPIHATTDATQRIFSTGVTAGQLLEGRDHAIRIEAAIGKVDIGVDANLQLPALLRSRMVDSYLSQALEVVVTLIRVYNVNRLMAGLESIFYKWEQDAVFFVRIVEESADVSGLIELGASKRNGSRGLLHGISLHRISSGAHSRPIE
jgi:hypothetical protein